MSLLLKRPRPSFASAFADTVRDDILHWISKSEARIGPDAYKAFISDLPSDEGNFHRLLEVAMAQQPGNVDAYRIANDLESYLNWPVDQTLVRIIADAVERTQERAHRNAVIAWVMETGTRFDQKAGDSIQYRGDHFDGQRTGRVVEVDRPTASATVADQNGGRIRVLAEDLVKAA